MHFIPNKIFCILSRTKFWFILFYGTRLCCERQQVPKNLQYIFPKMRGGGVKGRFELFRKCIRFGDFPNLGGTFLCFVIHMRTLQSPTYAYIGRTLKDVFLEVVFFD